MSEPRRIRLELRPMVKQQNQLRQRLLTGGSVLAVALLFGIGAFMYGNFGNSQEALAAIGANMGFENNLTEWTSSAGTWTSDATTPRSGSKSLKIAATTTAGRIYNNNSTITTPSSGTNYITVIVWAKASNANGRVKLGAYNSTNSTQSTQASYTTIASGSWTQVTYTVAATNNKVYYPVIYGMETSGTGNIFIDDAMIYTSTGSTPDITEPTGATAVTSTLSGSSPVLSWTAGTDAGSGIDGALILRASNLLSTDVPVNDQTIYSASSSLVGPTSITSGGTTWTVVYNGTNTNTFTDPSLLAAGSYTYLIYMRDKAGNFTSSASGTNAARMYVFIGSSTSQSINTATNIDGLYIPSGNTFQVLSSGALTIRSGATMTVNGTLEQVGTITNNGTVTVGSTGTYKYNRNGSASAGTGVATCTWSSGSTCLISGITTTAPTGLGQSFNNFTWNCASQSATIDLGGSLTTVIGNLTITSTGTGELDLSANGSTLTISGNYTQTGGIFVGSTADSNNGQQNGNFNGNFGNGNSAISIINLTGNYSQSGGTLKELGTDGLFTLNVTGNWSQTGGTLTTSGNAQTNIKIVFNKSGTQTFTASSNTVSSNVDYVVNSSSILDLGISNVLGDGFTLSSGGGLNIGSTSGITSSGATGNVRVTGTRSFSTGGNYTYNGSSAQVTGSGLPSTVNNLIINNSTGVTLSATVSVAGTLTITSGKVTTGSYEMKVTNTSVSSITGYGTSNYVFGNLRRSVGASGAYIFPLGTSTVYQPITITLVAQLGISNLLGTFTASAPGTPSGITISGVAVNHMLDAGYWTVTPNATMTAGTYTATINMTGYSTTGLNANTNYYLLKRHDVSSAWQGLGTQIPVAGQSIGGALQAASSLLTTWSDFGEGYGGGSTLPITLSSFTVTLVDNKYTDLNWVTSAELNNEYFSIERSADGKNYEAIGRVEGHGTSLVMNEYSFKDESPLEGESYYRLKQVDFDGPFTYSPIQSISNVKLTITSDDITLFPNPATFEINVAVQMLKEQTSDIEILDLTGRKVYSQTNDFNEGQNQFKLPLSDLPTGIYFVSINDGINTPVLKKFIKN